MRKRSALLAGVLSGLASTGTIGQTARYPTLEGSDLSRMRGDVQRVGNTFSSVLRREYRSAGAKANPKAKSG